MNVVQAFTSLSRLMKRKIIRRESMIPYSLKENLLILSLIKHRRIQLQCDREALSKAKLLCDRQSEKINEELEELRKLEISNRGYRL